MKTKINPEKKLGIVFGLSVILIGLMVSIISFQISQISADAPNPGHMASEIGGDNDNERTFNSSEKYTFKGDLEVSGGIDRESYLIFWSSKDHTGGIDCQGFVWYGPSITLSDLKSKIEGGIGDGSGIDVHALDSAKVWHFAGTEPNYVVVPGSLCAVCLNSGYKYVSLPGLNIPISDAITTRTIDAITGIDDDYTGYFSGGKGVKIEGDLNVSGKITATGGVDPPYVSFEMETREEIIERVAKEIPEEKLNQAIQFWNEETNQFEVYLPIKDQFMDLQGNILAEIEK